jgi:hypothetical protein
MFSTSTALDLLALARRIHVGSRVRYPGDVANPCGEGAVVDVTAPETSGASFTIVLDDGREFRAVPVSMFHGLRPWVILGGSRLSAEERAKLIAGAARAAKLDADRLAVAAEFPHLVRIETARSRSAAVAANIRRHFKANGLKPASIRTGRGSGVSSVHIRMPSGTSDADIAKAEKLASMFELGSFDGMSDCYRYAPSAFNDVFGGVRYVFVNG